MRIFSFADSTGLQVPSSAWTVPAAVQMAPTQGNGPGQPVGIGHNSGAQPMPEDDDKAAQRVRAIAEIRDWLANRQVRPDDYMSATEIATAANRMILLKRALADGAAYIRRALDALDPDPERRGTSLVIYVYLYDCLFSDNDEGCSTASNTRYAKLLGVGERAIRYARNLLVELHALVCTRRGGLENCYWPVINRRLTGDHVHLTWWLDATSDPINRGRTPGKPRHDTDRGLGKGNPGTDAQTPAPSVPDLKETPARIAITPARPFGQPIENKGNAGLEFTKEFTKEKEGADAPASVGADATKKPDAPRRHRKPSKAQATDAEIDEALAAYNEAAPVHGFTPCTKLTEERRKRLSTRLVDIGGVPPFKRALSALPKNDFLMGRVRPKNGGAPFRLDIDRLLSTGSGMGDVLARLIDAAGDIKPGSKSLDEEVQALRQTAPGGSHRATARGCCREPEEPRP